MSWKVFHLKPHWGLGFASAILFKLITQRIAFQIIVSWFSRCLGRSGVLHSKLNWWWSMTQINQGLLGISGSPKSLKCTQKRYTRKPKADTKHHKRPKSSPKIVSCSPLSVLIPCNVSVMIRWALLGKLMLLSTRLRLMCSTDTLLLSISVRAHAYFSDYNETLLAILYDYNYDVGVKFSNFILKFLMDDKSSIYHFGIIFH